MASEKSLPGSLATKESIREFLGSKVEKAGRGAKKDSKDRTFRGVDVEEEQVRLFCFEILEAIQKLMTGLFLIDVASQTNYGKCPFLDPST